MKYFSTVLASLIFSLFLGVAVVHAQGYVPLAPLPGTSISSATTTVNLSSYISGIIKLSIALGAGLAVLFAIIGGTQYVAAGISPDAKSGAKERIFNALIGLAIILSSYLLLRSINPKLVDDFKFSLPTVTPQVYQAPASALGQAWGDDSGVRSSLAAGTSITVNNQNCANIDETNCTSLFGLNGKAIAGLHKLAQSCTSWVAVGSCSITITGGTEYWLHKSHTTGTRVDLSQNIGTLNRFITKDRPSSVTSCGVSSDTHYMPLGFDGGVYVDEPNRDSNGNIISGRHWHVCYEI